MHDTNHVRENVDAFGYREVEVMVKRPVTFWTRGEGRFRPKVTRDERGWAIGGMEWRRDPSRFSVLWSQFLDSIGGRK